MNCFMPALAVGRADLGPAHLARAQDLDDLLELIAFALQRILDGLKAFQQTFGRQVFFGRISRFVRKTTGDAFVA